MVLTNGNYVNRWAKQKTNKTNMRWVCWFALFTSFYGLSNASDNHGTCPIELTTKDRWTPWWPESLFHALIGVNNTEQRLDYADTVIDVLEELGARVINVSSPKTGLVESSNLTGYWGLHLNNLDQFARFHPWQQVNSIPGTRDLFGDKDGLVKLERYARAQFGDEFVGWTPQSFILPHDRREFMVEARKSPSELYARKRLNTHSGSGVDIMRAESIVDYMENILTRCGRTETEWMACPELPFVAQKYVHDPLLIVHYKFDIRWWCVVTNIQPLRAYMLPDGYAKIASSMPYDSRDVSSKCAHVTNNMVQKHCIQKHHRPSIALEASVRDVEFERRIFPVQTEQLFEGAKDLLRKVLMASAWRLEANMFFTNTTARTFQMLAIDVIYEREHAKAVLLEVNTNGYLRSGILKIRDGRERLKEMFRLTGFVGYDREVVEKLQAKHRGDEELILKELEYRYRGGWLPLFE